MPTSIFRGLYLRVSWFYVLHDGLLLIPINPLCSMHKTNSQWMVMSLFIWSMFYAVQECFTYTTATSILVWGVLPKASGNLTSIPTEVVVRRPHRQTENSWRIVGPGLTGVTLARGCRMNNNPSHIGHISLNKISVYECDVYHKPEFHLIAVEKSNFFLHFSQTFTECHRICPSFFRLMSGFYRCPPTKTKLDAVYSRKSLPWVGNGDADHSEWYETLHGWRHSVSGSVWLGRGREAGRWLLTNHASSGPLVDGGYRTSLVHQTRSHYTETHR